MKRFLFGKRKQALLIPTVGILFNLKDYKFRVCFAWLNMLCSIGFGVVSK